jgi:hydrogenase assembly chaperone HypC/HupF
MCMSKPQKVLSCSGQEAVVDFEGHARKVKTPVPLKKGEWVLCSAGLVAKRIPADQAKEMLKEWSELNDF